MANQAGGDPIASAVVGSGAGIIAIVTAEVVTGWAQAASAVIGSLILLVTLANGIVSLQRNHSQHKDK